MKITAAKLADVATLAKLNQQLIRDEGHRNPMSLAELESRMASWLAEDYEAHLFQMPDRDEPIGYALARRDKEHVYLRQFFIVPAWRRRGLGREAFQWLLEHAWNTPRLRLDVLTGNATAIAFWHALGFADYCVTMERPTSQRG